MESDGSEFVPSEEDCFLSSENETEDDDLYTIENIVEALKADDTSCMKSVRNRDLFNSNKDIILDLPTLGPSSSEGSSLNILPTVTVESSSSINEGSSMEPTTISFYSLSHADEVQRFVNKSSADKGHGSGELPTLSPDSNEVEQFVCDEVTISDQSGLNSTNRGRSKSRSCIPTSKEWSRNKAKLRRMQGEPYMGFRRGSKGSTRRIIQDVPKEERAMGPTCTSPACLRWKTRLCGQINEDERKRLFEEFWKNMSWDTKKMFVCSTVDINRPKRRYSSNNNRNSTFSYNLRINGEKVPVCQTMYLRTLGLKRSEVRYWLENYRDQNVPTIKNLKKKTDAHSSEDNPVEGGDERPLQPPPSEAQLMEVREEQPLQSLIPEDQEMERGVGLPLQSNEMSSSSTSTTIKEQYEILQIFFDGLPKMPSHYCRKSTKRSYLQTDIRSWSQLYEMYKKKCQASNQKFLSRFSFDKERKKCQLSIFSPRKDRCDTCLSYETGHVSQSAYEFHIKKKEEAQNEKAKDKEAAEKGELWAICFDLMNVQNAPKIRANSAYYKLKLTLHNFSVYNLASHDALLYWFDESEANLGASTFASCIVDFILTLIEQEKKPIILYSDGCSYQNRNSIVANALLHVAVVHQITITHKYLEKGHTQMEGDSVHSTVEGFIKDVDVQLPSHYATLSQLARKVPMPYRTKYADHTFFKNFNVDQRMVYSSIRPGKGKGDPTVMDIRVLQYNPCGKIYYKLSFGDEFQELPVRRKSVTFNLEFPQLFSCRQSIPKDKWDDLQHLKKFLTPDAHAFYDQLPHDKLSKRQEKRSEHEEVKKRRKGVE